MGELSNSMWVVDKAGKLGLVDSMSAGDAVVRYRNPDGTFGELTRVAAGDAVQATVAQLPPNHGMAPAELEALGYAAAPEAPAAPASRAAPAAPTAASE